jgi:hypothetical protein
MKRTTTALKQEKEEAFMMVAAFYRTYNWRNENKYYCKCTIENDGIFNYATSYYYRKFRKANTYFI